MRTHPRESWEQMIERQDRDLAARLAFIRTCLACGFRMFLGANGLFYIIHPNTHDDRHAYPWQVTTCKMHGGNLEPYSHTTHKHLDLEVDHGCYYQSATWEIAWSILMDGEPTDGS